MVPITRIGGAPAAVSGPVGASAGCGHTERTFILERDESPEQAVAREVGEELGLTATAVELIGLYPFAAKNQLIIACHVRAVGEVSLNEELAEVRLIEPEKLKPWDFGTGPAVRDWLAARQA